MSLVSIPLRIFSAKIRGSMGKVLPIKLTIAVTFLCNSRCKTCNIWRIYKENPEMIRRELSPEDWFNLLKELSSSLLWIEFTGGEPFLKDGIDKILLYALRNTAAYTIGITTNAVDPIRVLSTIDTVVEDIPSNKHLVVGISLDGPPELHDEIRGIRGNFERAVNLYSKLKDLERKYGRIHVHFSYTISQYNAGYLREMYEYLKEIGIIDSISEISITIEHFTGFYNRPATTGNPYRRFAEAIRSDIENYLRYLKIDKSRSLVDRVRSAFYEFYAKKILEFIENPRKMIIPCAAGKYSAYIDPYGNVYPCTQWLVKLGNIKKHSFKEIWFSEKANKIRKEIEKGKCPNCWTPCEAQSSYVIKFSTLLFNFTKSILNLSLGDSK